MSKTATLYLSANISGDSQSESIGPLSIVLPNTPAWHIFQNIQSGLTNIPVPQIPNPAKFMLIIPPANSAITKALQSPSDPIGYAIDPAQPILVSIGAIASFDIRASGIETLEIWFF